MQRNGFSIVEIVVVLGIIAVLTGMSLLRADPDRARVDTSVQTLGLALGSAQRLATLRQHDVVVRFDEGAGAAIIHSDGDNDGVVDGNETVRFVTLEDGVVFDRNGVAPAPVGLRAISFGKQVQGMPALTFHRNGSTSEYGGFYLSSRSERPEHVRAIEVTRSTGEVRCYSFRTGSWEAAC